MRALFDVNLLVAMLDEEHAHHGRAQLWWAANRANGWASCPLTQNGFLRVVSQPKYSNPITLTFAHDFLGQQIASTDHAFWPDDISLLDAALVDSSRLLDSTQVTDSYLLALALQRGGKLATFDTRLVTDAVINGPKALHVIR